MSLERYTLRQIATVQTYRNDASMECLAAVAANADMLPSYGLLVNGSTHITDMASGTASTLWTRALGTFSSETLGVSASRSPQLTWTVDTVGDYSRLAALRCACRWMIFGAEDACRDCPGLLDDPQTNYVLNHPQFGVAERLGRLPDGWVGRGRLKDVPLHAAWKAHCKDTWVWVLPQQEWCLSEFILILHDIATIDPAATYSPPLLVTVTKSVMVPNSKVPSLSFDELRVVKPEYRKTIETAMHNGDAITYQEWIDYTNAYNGSRTTAKAGTPDKGNVPAGVQVQQNMIPPSRAYLEQLRIIETSRGRVVPLPVVPKKEDK